MSVQAIWVADHTVVSIPVHEHDYYQLMYCRGGTGDIMIGDTVYSAAPGNAYLSFPMEPHAFVQKDRLRLVEVKFTVEDDRLREELKRLPAEFSVDDNLLLRLALAEVKREALSHSLYSHESTNAALKLLLLRLVRCTYTENGGCEESGQNCLFEVEVPTRDKNREEFHLLKILDYIENHLSEQITLDDLTELVHFDKSYLITRFKIMWGVPPMQYVNLLRLERAKVMLTMTEKSITEIAGLVGFQSIHYFSRYFKAKENITPNEYRIQRKRQSMEDTT